MSSLQVRGLNRNTIDKFYTNSQTVELCIKEFNKVLFDNTNTEDLIIEPSAGNGAFIDKIKKITSNYKFYDIDPENEEITKLDFLNIENSLLASSHIIGNPPFGRQSSLALKFIKKCCNSKVKSISFILPLSFRKDSMKKHFNLNYHLISEIDIPVNSFLSNGEIINVPCVFQIWKYFENKREQIEKIIPSKFKFVKKTENPDISFRRVGINAGKVSSDIDDKNENCHYFIKFNDDESFDFLVDKISNLNFEHNNTVGPRSISKQELLYLFEKL